MSDTPVNPTTPAKSDALSPQTPIRPTEVFLIQGKKANRDFKSALSLLKETNYKPPSVRDEQEEVAEYYVPEEAGHNASQHQHNC